jgi:diguanylate cyclase (GGDEF)-like protein
VYKGQKLIFCICRDITERKLLEDEVYRYATTDTLTGLYNRRTFGERLQQEMERASRHGAPLSLIMYDFDAFKAINDEFGHGVGDDVLQQSAALVSQNVRSADMVVRWGGEEFMILAPHTSLANAAVLAEKLRQAIEAQAFSSEFNVTASFGAAEYVSGEGENKLLKRVDDALYQAKTGGRNRVEVLVAT